MQRDQNGDAVVKQLGVMKFIRFNVASCYAISAP